MSAAWTDAAQWFHSRRAELKAVWSLLRDGPDRSQRPGGSSSRKTRLLWSFLTSFLYLYADQLINQEHQNETLCRLDAGRPRPGEAQQGHASVLLDNRPHGGLLSLFPAVEAVTSRVRRSKLECELEQCNSVVCSCCDHVGVMEPLWLLPKRRINSEKLD